ncbi:MAG: RNA polymerase sigma factor [Clostridiales bacterium]|jgi:RNA polymerase sigma-70 factor (ECF subfamily)|nr:RNA polymerase sigma factor [Clostridiales bacterium]MBD9279375.1 RNA polymerase sigma factor [Clostridiales bacterium]MBD9283771.1 RNA polymerase sigma factor [Clostridiales bacterium]
MSEPTSKHKEESAVQQALDSPAAAKGLDDSYQPVPDVRDDPAYFARLYDQYATDVLRVCYFYLSDREKAEDVCQDVFVRLMTTHPVLQPGREKSWLLKVALNRCRDLWRGAWLKRVILGGPTFELIPAPDEFSRRDDQQAMMAAINQLPATFKEVILLHYYQGMNIAEIAQMLELPEGTISSRLSRGRKKLESILLKGGDAR